jgi:hypothetical protein
MLYDDREMYLDAPEVVVLRTTQHVAKRPHTCDTRVCRRTIGIGETYPLDVWVEDGEFKAMKLCKVCREPADQEGSHVEQDREDTGNARVRAANGPHTHRA